MNSELNNLLLKQMEQLIKQNERLDTQNQLLQEQNQLLKIENQRISNYNRDLKDSAQTWRTQAKEFENLNQHSIRVIQDLVQANTQQIIIECVSNTLFMHLKERMKDIEIDLISSIQPQIKAFVTQTLQQELNRMTSSLQEDHLLLRKQISKLSNAL